MTPPKSVLNSQKDKPSEEIEVGDLIIRHLENIGVDCVFGVPGGAIEPIYNALARSGRKQEKGVQVVTACHEAAAAYMADGYARETGKLGVCMATSGPGATNMLTGVACAYDNNIPMLVITGQPALPSFGKGALQESSCTGVNVVGMYRHCTRYNSLVSHPGQLETKLVNAILQAQQNPKGPAHLSIPVDILRSKVLPNGIDYNLQQQISRQNGMIDEIATQELQDALEQSEAPIFLIGCGTGDAIEAIMQLVAICGAKFITTPDAKGLINPRHRSYCGVFGLAGHNRAVELLQNHQGAIVAFGTGFGEFSSSGWCTSVMNNKLIHVDACEENLNRTPMARLHVRGNIHLICARISKNIVPKFNPPPSGNTNNVYQENFNPNFTIHDTEKYYSNETPIKPQRLMKELSDRFPSNTRFVADAGNSMMWAPHYLQPRNKRMHVDQMYWSDQDITDRRKGSNWLRLTLDFAPMGWAVGSAVGIARGNPKCPVVCITGDGSYLMSGQEITVAARENLTVIYIILNDGVYGMVMHGQRLAKAEPIAFQLPQVNYASMANSMGIEGHVINSPEDFNEIDFEKILSAKKPTLFDVRIDKEEVPPMVMRLKTLGSADMGLQ